MQFLLAALSTGSLALALPLVPGVPATLEPASVPARVAPACEDAYLGVFVLQSAGGGAEVTRLMPGSPAEKAGIRPGDRIVGLGGTPIDDEDALIAGIDARSAGDEVEVVLRRGGEEILLTLALGAWAEAEPRYRSLPGALTRTGAGGLPLAGGLSVHDGHDGHDGRDGRDGRGPRGAEVETTPTVPVEPPAGSASGWVSVAPGDTSEPPASDREDLHARLDEMRARMEERWAELSQELERARDAREPSQERKDRIDDLRRELESSRREQERRMEELRDAIHGARAPGPPRLRVELPRGAFRAQEPVRHPPGQALLDAPPASAEAPPASAEAIRSLHDDVRALRREIQELKELLGAAREPR